MSMDKHPRMFSPQMETFVFIILEIYYATRAILKIGEYPRIFPSFSWGIFAHVTRLDQSRASENIRWITIINNRKMNITGLSGRINDWGKTIKQGLHRLGFQSVAVITR